MSFFVKPVPLELAYIAIYLMFNLVVNALEAVQAWFVFLGFKF